MQHRTRAYWPTRVILSIPFVSLAIVVLLVLTAPSSMGAPAPYSGVGATTVAVAAALWVVGTVWMLRIVRGPRDESGEWRYRA